MTYHGQDTPPADPWSGDALTVGYARSGDTQVFPRPDFALPKRSRTPLVVGIGVVVALLAGVGAYAAASVWYGWSVTEPEQVVPGTVALYARLDLSPGLGQRLALGRVAQKFPHDGDGRDIADQLKREFLGVDAQTYDAEIRPWLGDRLATATWSPDRTGAKACLLTALASTDDVTAEASLRRVQQRQSAAAFGFVRRDGYAVVVRCDGRTDSQAAAQAASSQTDTQSLAHLPAFRTALGELPGHHAALAWADLAAAQAVQNGAAVGVDGVTLPADVRTGQLIAGLEATGNGLDLNFRLSGAGVPRPTVDVMPRLAALPDTTTIGICTDLSASTVVTQIGQMVASALAGGAFAALGTGLASALGSVLSLSVSAPASGAGDPTWRLAAETPSPTGARAIALAFALPAFLNSVTVDVNGNTVTATSRGYQVGTGRLADSATYRAAMGQVNARPAAAAFVNVATLLPTLRLTAAEAARLKPIRAAGLVAGDDNGTLAGLIRLVIP